MEKGVTIHGCQRTWATIKDEVEWAVGETWKKKQWKRRSALISIKGGSIWDYVGQQYNPEKVELIENGWIHDHCEICNWRLSESENLDEGEGFTTNNHTWICTECHEKFINGAKGPTEE